MKRIRIIFLTLAVFSIYFGMSKIFTYKALAAESLNDISTHWANKEITTLLKDNIVQGYADGSFKPNKNVSVSEFLKMIVEMADYKLITKGNQWPDWYIETAIENSLIKKEDFADYSKPITRIEASKIIANYIKLDDVTKNNNTFKDLENETKETREIVLKLAKLGVINGYTDNTFKGNNLVTRAEACKIILNSYKAKQELMKTREGKLISQLTNIKDSNASTPNAYEIKNNNNSIPNTYEIKENRLYMYDTGKYANLNSQTLNQEYINDKLIIKALKKLVAEDSYTELKFVPDKYIINSLNLCYRNKFSDIDNGAFIFEIKFYENAYYDVSISKDNSKFMQDAIIKIRTGQMWQKNSELETASSCNEKNLYKLKEVIGAILGDNVKEEFINYIIEKRIEAGKIENSENPKIAEIKKIGKYTINTFCMNDKDIEIYIKKF